MFQISNKLISDKISITSISSISPLGNSTEEVWKNYQSVTHRLTQKKFKDQKAFISELSNDSKTKLTKLIESDNKYKDLDPTVLFAIYASREAINNAGWNAKSNFGINIGSSRGATSLFEKYHETFINTRKSQVLTSPTTTLGNISSWVAHDLQTQGPEISHSITCSTALHSLLNGIAWIKSGMADKFLVGGSEAPLTPFTIAQMQAMKIYSKYSNNSTLNTAEEYPCRAFDLNKTVNTMVLGEGAAVACLERYNKNAIAVIEGVGYATEVLTHGVSISTNADCFQKSMKMALKNTDPNEVDVIVMHAPGTIKGDMSEVNAIKKIFCNKSPFLTTNKWKIGHTFGASGLLSLELAVLMLQNQQFVPVPYIEYDKEPKQLNKILINAVGFGGNAVSVLLRKP